MNILDTGVLAEFLADHGPALDLAFAEPGSASGLAPCWHQHPIVVTELTGIALAWTALLDAFDPPTDADGLTGAVVIPAPRDWLDLANATAPARERAKAATHTCARAGHHIAATPLP